MEESWPTRDVGDNDAGWAWSSLPASGGYRSSGEALHDSVAKAGTAAQPLLSLVAWDGIRWCVGQLAVALCLGERMAPCGSGEEQPLPSQRPALVTIPKVGIRWGDPIRVPSQERFPDPREV